MLAYIFRLIRDFEQEHEIHPNLLFMNKFHFEHLKNAFSETYSLPEITELLNVNIVVNQNIIHPHVSWSHVAENKVAS